MSRSQAIALLVVASLAAAPAAGAGLRVETRPASPAPAQLFQVRVEAGDRDPGTAPELRIGGRTFPLWAGGEGWEGLAVLDRDTATGVQELSVIARAAEGERLLGTAEIAVGRRDYGVQELRVDERMVTLSPEDAERAERENRLIRSVLAAVTRERFWAGPFAVPVPGAVTGPFGVRRVFNGKPKNYHGGVDIGARRGAQVEASAAGRVALVGDYFYTGNTVFLDHGFGLYTAYFHMESVAVAEGDKVETGAVLGRVGSTGRSTGPHLHWGVYLSGLRVDPTSLVELTGAAGVGGGENP